MFNRKGAPTCTCGLCPLPACILQVKLWSCSYRWWWSVTATMPSSMATTYKDLTSNITSKASLGYLCILRGKYILWLLMAFGSFINLLCVDQVMTCLL